MSRIMVNLAKVDKMEVAKQTGVPTEHVERVIGQIVMNHNNYKRQPKPLVPEGGICLRAAERKYGISNRTLSGWVKKGYIPILLRTKNELYVDENKLGEVVSLYKTSPGQGKLTIKQSLVL